MSSRIDQHAYELLGPDFSAAVQTMLARLRREFPEAFGMVRPLALGIREALVARTTLSDAEVSSFLTFYTRSAAYLRAQAQPGAVRVDLDGNVVEAVSTDNSAFAAERLHHELARRREHAQWLAFRGALLDPLVMGDDIGR